MPLSDPLKVYFLRHAEAENSSPTGDFGRALTERGRGQATVAGRWAAARGLRPARLLASPLVRAQQTAELAGAVLGVPPETADWLASGRFDLRGLLENLREEFTRSTPVMLVGHEPDFSEVIGALIGPEGSPARVEVKKASLILVEVGRWRAGGGTLCLALGPRLMER